MRNQSEITLKLNEKVYRNGISTLQNANALAECLKYCDFNEVDKTHVMLAFEVIADLTLQAVNKLHADIKEPSFEMVNGRVKALKGWNNGSRNFPRF